jgi:hypothetical protein
MKIILKMILTIVIQKRKEKMIIMIKRIGFTKLMKIFS